MLNGLQRQDAAPLKGGGAAHTERMSEARVRKSGSGGLPEVTGVASLRARRDELGLTEKEKTRLQLLRRRDLEVRAHEQQHIAKGQGLIRSTPNYTMVKGPDGRLYAIGGHVHIDTSPAPTPEETIEKAKRIREAALAPGDRSAQDLKVAARATMMEMRARGEMKIRSQTQGAQPPAATRIHSGQPLEAFLRLQPASPRVFGVA